MTACVRPSSPFLLATASDAAAGVRAEPQASAPTIGDLFSEHAAFVLRVLRRLGVSERDVEDVAQDVFVTAHTKLFQYDPRSSARAWVYGIARRRASDYRRSARVRRERTDEPEIWMASEATQESDAERRRRRALLDRALDGLSDEQREVFVLYELEEMAMADIAALAGCPVQTAYARLYRARKLVKQAVEEHPGRTR